MRRIDKHKIVFTLGLFAFIGLLGLAGTPQYNEEVIQSMGNEVYMIIYDKLGHGCSNSSIVEEYMNNRAYYDSIRDSSWE